MIPPRIHLDYLHVFKGLNESDLSSVWSYKLLSSGSLNASPDSEHSHGVTVNKLS